MLERINVILCSRSRRNSKILSRNILTWRLLRKYGTKSMMLSNSNVCMSSNIVRQLSYMKLIIKFFSLCKLLFSLMRSAYYKLCGINSCIFSFVAYVYIVIFYSTHTCMRAHKYLQSHV